MTSLWDYRIQNTLWKQDCFSCHWEVGFLLYLKHFHVTAVIAKASMIRQAFETHHEIDDKLTNNPHNPFKHRTVHSNSAYNWCHANIEIWLYTKLFIVTATIILQLLCYLSLVTFNYIYPPTPHKKWQAQTSWYEHIVKY